MTLKISGLFLFILSYLLAFSFAPSVAQVPTQTHTFLLAWIDNSVNPQEAGYKIERCQGSGCSSFSQVGQVGANVVAFKDTIANDPGSVTYCYRVKAFSTTPNVTDSVFSNVACGVTPAVAPVQLNPPSGLTISALSSSMLELSWSDNSTGENAQKIRWRQFSPPRSGEIIVAANQVSYRMSSVQKNKTRCATVAAISGPNESAESNESCATTRR